jgi:Rrf2 family iron-sulfur cluster assembly transcriptional regulator
MWLSSTAQHAIRAVLYVAEHAESRPVRVDEIAAALGNPRNYLSKTLHALTRAGVLRSERGPKGGFQLVDAPAQLSIARIVAPFEPVSQRRCLFGRPECGGRHPCAAHDRWSRVATGVERFFDDTTIADLLGEDTATSAPRKRRASPARPASPPKAARPKPRRT